MPRGAKNSYGNLSQNMSRKRHSPPGLQYALLVMIEKWKLSLDNSEFAGGILMDLSKAFDTINHKLLIAKLHAYGFNINALEIILDYLSDRLQRIKINTEFCREYHRDLYWALIFSIYI